MVTLPEKPELDWLEYGHTGDEDYGFKKFIGSVDALILGRNTYEVILFLLDIAQSRYESPLFQDNKKKIDLIPKN